MMCKIMSNLCLQLQPCHDSLTLQELREYPGLKHQSIVIFIVHRIDDCWISNDRDLS